MGTEVVPERVDAGTSRRLVGHTFSQGKFDKLKGEDGCISREQHLNEMAGASALEMGDLGKSKSTTGSEIAFSFQDISFTVQDKKTKTEKVIIQNVSATVTPGHVLAIMGPSGAGKTTLINSLTLSAFGGVTTGSVKLGSDHMTPSLFEQHCYVVTQQDFHWPFLTCRETLQYAAELYLQDDATAREERVNTVIKKMGLESCADTICGNEFVQGLSGGQKRRLSIGLALIKEPMLIFLDEPTSGLDAAAAANIMRFITELAAEDQLIVVATIHQPSTKVYEGFDQTMILSRGREAYRGQASEAVGYFASIGHPMPKHTNPAEFFLDLVNSDFASDEDVERILKAWEDHTAKQSGAVTQALEGSVRTREAAGVDFFSQFLTMLRRHAYLAYKDPVPYVGRSIIFLIGNLYFAAVYIKARNRNQEQVLNRFWFIVWILCVPTQIAVVAVYTYNAEFNSVRKEIKNGMVSPTAYLVAKGILEVPIMYIFTLFSIGIPAYAVMNFDGFNFGLFSLMFALQMYIWEAMAELFSVQFRNPLLGMMQIMNMWFSGFLYAGFLIPADDMVYPFKIFYWILPMKYGIRSLVHTEFIDSEFNGCQEGVDCDQDGNYGRDGDHVLDSLRRVFGVVTSDSTYMVDFLVSIAILVVFKVLYIVTFMKKSRASTHVTAK